VVVVVVVQAPSINASDTTNIAIATFILDSPVAALESRLILDHLASWAAALFPVWAQLGFRVGNVRIRV
jgi:hypothetical protein